MKYLGPHATAKAALATVKQPRCIRAQSPARARASRDYRATVKEWLKGKLCCACYQAPATQCHHSHGRQGKLLNYEPFWKAICQGCHDRAHRDIPWGRSRNLFCDAGRWNDQTLVK